MATSKFLRLFLTNAGEPLLGATIYLVPQANSYPTGAILLTAHPTRSGIYEADGVAHGEYKIYIGSGTPTLYTEHIWVGENFISIIADKFDVVTNQLTTAGIKDNAVTSSKIAANAVAGSHIASGSVAEAQLASNAVTSAKISVSAVSTAKIADAAVTTTKIDVGAVTAICLNDAAVETQKIANNAVTTGKIANSAVDSTKLADNAVTTTKIVNGAITDIKISNGAVTNLKLASDSVTTGKIADDAVTKAKLNPDIIGIDGGLAQNVDGSLKLDYDGSSIGLGYGYQVSILDDGVERSHINPNVAGAGLGQNIDGSLEVKTDGISLEVVSDQVRLRRKEIHGILQFSGGGRSFTQIYNSTGATLTVTREDVGIYTITASSGIFTTQKTIGYMQPQVPSQVHIGVRRYSDTIVRIEAEDTSGASIDLDGNFYLSVSIFP